MVPLRRNRDFMLLQAGQLLSTAGTQSTAIAYPLLVLAVTHSASKTGLVSFARFLPYALFSLPAGLAADRWSRKRLMIASDVLRAVAVASLPAALLAHVLSYWQLPVVAFVEGIGAIVFGTAATGAVRSVVPAVQLPDAVALQTARGAAVQLAGPPLGGALFGVGRAIPFLVDAVSYVFSTASVLAMRTPFEEARERDTASVRARLAEGFRFLWGQPFVRTCAFLYAFADFSGPGVLLMLVVVARRQGLSPGAVGALSAIFGGSLLLGASVSTFVRRVLPVVAILRLEACAWPLVGVFAIWPSVYVLTAVLVPIGFAIPNTDAVVKGYRSAITPDRLIGRVTSATSAIALLAAPLGPLLAGFLLQTSSARVTAAVFAAVGGLMTAWALASPAIRAAPSLDELAGLDAEPGLP